MIRELYEGRGKAHDGPKELPTISWKKETDPAGYVAESDLRDAANVALLLGQPLLLTGEPGTGKTQFAHSLAYDLGLGTPLEFSTKAASQAQDLFYLYDALGRFHAASDSTGKSSSDVRDYLTFQALGCAILDTLPREHDSLQALMRSPGAPPAGAAAAAPESTEDAVRRWTHSGPRRWVVLVDEVDKAPRDFPNDILLELERMWFRVPELRGAEVEAERKHKPIVVITSNSEKNLPEAFLRRCVYYHIPFPDGKPLLDILERRLGAGIKEPQGFLDDALTIFDLLRKPATGLIKPPATAELIKWLRLLQESAPAGTNPLREDEDLARQSLTALVKTESDRESALSVLKRMKG